MYNIARLSAKERNTIIGKAASSLRLHEAIIEKDFWVCLMLDYLFHKSPWQEQLAFKGGTSLSKAYHIISRFSEDIDLILDWRLLGYNIAEPWEERSRTKQNTFNEEANYKTANLLKNEFLYRISNDIEKLTGHKNSVSIIDSPDNKDCEQTIIFRYPKSFTTDSILPEIRLEFGALAAWTPLENKYISPLIGDIYPHIFKQLNTQIRTTSVERAFWEKATILHREANRPVGSYMPARYARHYYDLHCIYHSPYKDSILNSLSILEKVNNFKDKFYYNSWAKYMEAWPGTFKLLPANHNLDILKKDYSSMKTMIYGECPSFDNLIQSIQLIEYTINSISVDK